MANRSRSRRSRPGPHFHPDDDFWPSVWSPDSQRVRVFASSRTRKGVFDLYQRAAAGAATPELLWESAESKSPSGFSPDGRILLVDRWVSGGSSVTSGHFR